MYHLWFPQWGTHCVPENKPTREELLPICAVVPLQLPASMNANGIDIDPPRNLTTAVLSL